jgi:glutamyl-tRNA reductase
MNLFRQEWHQRQVEKMLHPMISEIKQVKTRAVETVFAEKINDLDPSSKELLLEILNYMERKCVAIPVKTIKKIANAKTSKQMQPK